MDISRIIYTGHSRGGHGALIMGVNIPDKALAVVPISGWIKREKYGDANIIFDLDTSMSYLDPALKWVILHYNLIFILFRLWKLLLLKEILL